MTFRLLDEYGPCPLSATCHPAKPIVQYCQLSWMSDYRFNRKRCSICLKSIPKSSYTLMKRGLDEHYFERVARRQITDLDNQIEQSLITTEKIKERHNAEA